MKYATNAFSSLVPKLSLESKPVLFGKVDFPCRGDGAVVLRESNPAIMHNGVVATLVFENIRYALRSELFRSFIDFFDLRNVVRYLSNHISARGEQYRGRRLFLSGHYFNSDPAHVIAVLDKFAGGFQIWEIAAQDIEFQHVILTYGFMHDIVVDLCNIANGRAICISVNGVFSSFRTVEYSVLARTAGCKAHRIHMLAYRRKQTSDLYYVRGRTMTQKPYMVCSTYRNIRGGCTSHSITIPAIEECLLDGIRSLTTYARENENDFVEMVMQKKRSDLNRSLRDEKRELEQAQMRIRKLDEIIRQLYEDKIEGRISDERFSKLTDGYELEQKTLESRSSEIRSHIASENEATINVNYFLSLVRKYSDVQNLSGEIVREFVEKIYVSQAETIDGERCRKSG